MRSSDCSRCTYRLAAAPSDRRCAATSESTEERGGPALGVRRVDRQAPPIVEQSGDAGRARRSDAREAAGHGFEQRVRHPLGERREHERVGGTQIVRDPIAEPDEAHALLHAQVGGEPLEHRTFRTVTDEQELDLGCLCQRVEAAVERS